MVKHLASVEVGYFGDTFGRPFAEPLLWLADDAEPNADMWATADESRASLDARGHVPWWPEERSAVTLHQILVHMVAETNRHAGHADIVRELIDGAVGLREVHDNMAPGTQAWWEDYRRHLERVAQDVSQG